MGLLDGMLGQVLNNLSGAGAQAGDNPILQMVQGLMQQNGGLAGLVDMLGKHGLAEQAQSWVGTGDNLPVSAEQIGQALGSGPLAELAGKFGLDTQAVSGGLAQYLPEIVNQLTPQGRVPDDGNAVEQGLAALAGKLFG
ncbi:MAG: YidB family protein [Thiobacillaceae bacterium]|jgi:uncharacterized protein YidB (DUF937 family)|nr:YidB family protein [Thiobacillaceae bacterium]